LIGPARPTSGRPSQHALLKLAKVSQTVSRLAGVSKSARQSAGLLAWLAAAVTDGLRRHAEWPQVSRAGRGMSSAPGSAGRLMLAA